MKKFIIKINVFLIPILFIGLFSEVLLRNIPNDYLYKKKYLDNSCSKIETLILGSSHSFRGLNPEFFSSNSFNASYVSQSLNYDYRIFKKYENNLVNLKTIILPISYFTLYGKLENGIESWRIKNYVIYYGMNVSNSITDYSEILSNLPKINLKRLNLFYRSGKSDLTCSKLGWGTIFKAEDAKNLTETGISAAKRHTKGNLHSEQNQSIFNENKLILYSFIKWGKDHNVKIIFFTPPAYETYRNNISLEQLNITIETISKITKEHDNCMYLNLFSDSSFTAEDFYDGDHLSTIGSKKLSILIDKKINEWK